jgi:hypothetical protein
MHMICLTVANKAISRMSPDAKRVADKIPISFRYKNLENMLDLGHITVRAAWFCPNLASKLPRTQGETQTSPRSKPKNDHQVAATAQKSSVNSTLEGVKDVADSGIAVDVEAKAKDIAKANLEETGERGDSKADAEKESKNRHRSYNSIGGRDEAGLFAAEGQQRNEGSFLASAAPVWPSSQGGVGEEQMRSNQHRFKVTEEVQETTYKIEVPEGKSAGSTLRYLFSTTFFR